MKLTLEHLAPYLPYALGSIRYFEEHKLKGDVSLNNVMNFIYGDTRAKILLRPLSDYKDIDSQAMSDLNCDLSDQMGLCDLANKHTNVEAISYQLAQICFENHIDIFRLIEKGLAINMNEI